MGSTSNPTVAAALNLTFGFELEFICVYPPHIFDNFMDDYPDFVRDYGGVYEYIRAGHAIYLKLRKHSLPVTGWESLSNDGPMPESYSCWFVKEDASLYLTENEKRSVPQDWVVENLEINSRKFYMSDTASDWASELRIVLEVLFELESQGCRMLTNYSTGLHVHIGNDSQIIPLDTAKRVFQLGTIFAPVMDQLHAFSRIKPADTHGSCYCLPPGYFHMRNDKNPQNANIFDWMGSIEDVTSYAELGDLFITFASVEDCVGTDGHNSAYNFDNLILDSGLNEVDIKKTIEFRQHIGFCHTASDLDFFALLMYGVDPSTGIRDMCSAVGLDADFTSHLTGELELPYQPSRPTRIPTYLYKRVLDTLDETNDEESAELRDPNVVKQVIDQKMAGGLYGINPAINIIRHSKDAMAELLFQAYRYRNVIYPDVALEQRDSLARAILLYHLASLYAGDGPVLLLETSGPVCGFWHSAGEPRIEL